MLIEEWLKPKALTWIPYELKGWAAQGRHSTQMGDLLGARFWVHPTTYDSPGHTQGSQMNQLFSINHVGT